MGYLVIWVTGVSKTSKPDLRVYLVGVAKMDTRRGSGGYLDRWAATKCCLEVSTATPPSTRCRRHSMLWGFLSRITRFCIEKKFTKNLRVWRKNDNYQV